MTRLMPLLVCGFALVAGIEGSTTNAAPTFDLEWTKTRWAEANSFELPTSVVIRWRTTTYTNDTPEDLHELQTVVGNRIDHPLRQKMEEMQRRLTLGPDSNDFTLWYQNDTRFRLSETFLPPRPLTYNDLGVDGKSAWRFHDRTLYLYSMNKVPEGEDPYFHIRPLNSLMVYFLYGGLVAGPLDRSPVSVNRSGSSWTCDLETPSGDRRFRQTGTIVNTGGRESLHIIESRTVHAIDESLIGSSIRFLDWRHEPFLNRDIAHRVEMRWGSGPMYYSIDLLEIRALNPGELDPILATPAADGHDAIRGALTVRAVNDSRTGRSLLRTDTGDILSDRTPTESPAVQYWKLVAIIGVALAFVLVAVKINAVTKTKGS